MKASTQSPSDQSIKAGDSTAPRSRTRTLVLVGLAALLVAGAGAAAAVSLSGGGDDGGTVAAATDPAAIVQPSPSASASVSSSTLVLPTTEVLGRNVFAPLLDVAPAGELGSTEGLVDVTSEAIEAAPVPPAATVTQPAVTVTEFNVVTQTIEATETLSTTVTSTVAGFTHQVTIAAVTDPSAANTSATFVVNGQTATVAIGGSFAPGFTYTGYDAVGGKVTFMYDGTRVVASVGEVVGLQ